MKWLPFPQLPPKSPSPSATATATATAAASSLSLPFIFPTFTQYYPRNFVAPIIGRNADFKQSICSPSHRRQMAATATGGGAVSSSPEVIKLKAIEATPESFKEFGQVIEASPDGDEFGPRDAQLDLSRGIPRFYIMHIEDRPLEFSTITHHANVTQCLGSIGGHVWYLGVAKPSLVENPDEVNNAVKSRCGHSFLPPAVEQVRVFKVSGPKFLKLDRGTWHAGPLFLEKAMDFYNLELSNTNVVDHTTHNFAGKDNIIFAFDE